MLKEAIYFIWRSGTLFRLWVVRDGFEVEVDYP